MSCATSRNSSGDDRVGRQQTRSHAASQPTFRGERRAREKRAQQRGKPTEPAPRHTLVDRRREQPHRDNVTETPCPGWSKPNPRRPDPTPTRRRPRRRHLIKRLRTSERTHPKRTRHTDHQRKQHDRFACVNQRHSLRTVLRQIRPQQRDRCARIRAAVRRRDAGPE
jgi:hypothetical protein